MNNTDKLISDYSKALTRLEESLSTDADTDREKAGCIQFFEFSFELAWKTIKAYAESQGLECFSPKEALKIAYNLNLIKDENIWLAMLKARNLMSHTYDEDKSLEVYYSLVVFLTELKNIEKKFVGLSK